MKKRKDYRSELPLADMHTDGVRFNSTVLQAQQNQSVAQEMGQLNSSS
ncbi:MAG: hypothetical protein KJO16_00210 [Muriicola sp.]|nr:hypothetical protein [Muriicola sp.]NNK12046.1 hypothetical protein [Flavobacteriaceae bacterium]